jgi:4-hydroxy 2-oxovalerate aldolase
MTSKPRINVFDTTLRDGMHTLRHQFELEDVRKIARGLDEAGVAGIEVAHGDGLAGSSIQYGFSKFDDLEYLRAARDEISRSLLTTLLLPGIGTMENLRASRDAGASVVRVATLVTEADIGEQHIGLARELGMTAVGFLMMSHIAEPEKVAEQGAMMESYGANVVYVVDSAGALTPNGARDRVSALRAKIAVDVGFHAHNNLGLAIGNSLAAAEAGATYLDGSLRGFGAGSGNAPTEVLCAALDRAGYETGVNLGRILDIAEKGARPLLRNPGEIDSASVMLGYAGVYSSFLLHARRGSERFGVDVLEILAELGRRKVVGGQEDTIIDVAYELSLKKGRRSDAPAAEVAV